MRKVDVAIIGGGPGGLTTAISIKRACRHLNVKVYERVQQITPRGAGIRVGVNGEKALHAIDPALHAALHATGRNPSSSLRFDDQGEVVGRIPSTTGDSLSKWGYETFFIGWSDLQQTLADHLATVAEPDTLQLGAQFSSMRVEDDGVALDFGDSLPPVKASVVVGADGYRSKVRQLWLDDGPPEFAGAVIFRGRLPEDVCPLPLDSFAFYLQGPTVSSLYPGNKGHIVWNCSATMEALEKVGLQRLATSQQSSVHEQATAPLSGEEIKLRALQVFAKHPRVLRESIELTDPEAVMEHDVCYRSYKSFPDSGVLGSGPVTLMGDAAHATRPAGQGLNQAFEDALGLGHCLRECGPTEAALRAYETALMPRWKLSSAVSEVSAKSRYYGADALAGEEKRLALELPEMQARLLGVELRPLVEPAVAGA